MQQVEVQKTKKQKMIIGALSLLILAAAVFLYMAWTRNTMLMGVPFIPRRLLTPVFAYHFEEAGLNSPRGITLDPLGKVYVADQHNNWIRVYQKDGKVVGEIKHKELKSPYDVVAYNGFLYVADLSGGKVVSFSFAGSFGKVVLARGQNGLGVFSPAGITVDPDSGQLYISDVAEHRVVVCTRDGEVLFTFGGSGQSPGSFAFPNSIALDREKNIYVTDSNNTRVQIFSPDGQKVLGVIDGGEGGFSLPAGLAVDRNGFVWVIDTFTHSINAFDGNKKVVSVGQLGVEEGELYFPCGLAFDPGGFIFVTERALNRVSVFQLRASAGTGR